MTHPNDYRRRAERDGTLRQIGSGLAIVGFLVLLCGDWETGVQYIGAGFVGLGALVIIIDRLIGLKERK